MKAGINLFLAALTSSRWFYSCGWLWLCLLGWLRLAGFLFLWMVVACFCIDCIFAGFAFIGWLLFCLWFYYWVHLDYFFVGCFYEFCWRCFLMRSGSFFLYYLWRFLVVFTFWWSDLACCFVLRCIVCSVASFLLFGILYCWSAFYAPEGFCWLLELGFVVMSECRQWFLGFPLDGEETQPRFICLTSREGFYGCSCFTVGIYLFHCKLTRSCIFATVCHCFDQFFFERTHFLVHLFDFPW